MKFTLDQLEDLEKYIKNLDDNITLNPETIIDINNTIEKYKNINNPTRKEYTLEVNQFIDELEEIFTLDFDLDMIVKYDFDLDARITQLESWRGVYSELTLAYDYTSKDITLGELLMILDCSIDGKIFKGYKGSNNFRMNVDTPVWADPSGVCGERMIIGVDAESDHIVLKTKKNITE